MKLLFLSLFLELSCSEMWHKILICSQSNSICAEIRFEQLEFSKLNYSWLRLIKKFNQSNRWVLWSKALLLEGLQLLINRIRISGEYIVIVTLKHPFIRLIRKHSDVPTSFLYWTPIPRLWIILSFTHIELKQGSYQLQIYWRWVWVGEIRNFKMTDDSSP